MKTTVSRTLVITVFVLSMLACNFATSAVQPTATSLPPQVQTTALPTKALVTAQPTQAMGTDLPTQMLTTQTPENGTQNISSSGQVTVTMKRESLSIRRGPSIDYNVLDFFLAGQSAVASFRDAQSDWVYIPLPGNSSASGWVSLLTEYTSVQGNVSSLPVKDVDPAVPPIIRNCTQHPMLVQPGNVLLQPKYASPNNSHKFPPGSYAIYDQNQEGYPKVASFTLVEGNKVDITVDGLGNAYTCP